jgi:hypothetical protein
MLLKTKGFAPATLTAAYVKRPMFSLSLSLILFFSAVRLHMYAGPEAHVPGIYNIFTCSNSAEGKRIAAVTRPRTSLINRGNRVNASRLLASLPCLHPAPQKKPLRRSPETLAAALILRPALCAAANFCAWPRLRCAKYRSQLYLFDDILSPAISAQRNKK